MTRERLSMKKIMEILRLGLGDKLSLRKIGSSVNCSPSKVHNCLSLFEKSGLTWPLPKEINENEIMKLLYPPGDTKEQSAVKPDFVGVHKELKRKGVTLYLLWQEYKIQHPDDGIQYSQYCNLYSKFSKKLKVTMRQKHKAGDKVFVDWSGDGIEITNPETGEITVAPVFVGTLGASNYTYVTAKTDRKSRNWIACHIEMYEFFKGVPAATIPDNEKTGVTLACLYDPDLNRTYADMAKHYGTTMIPTRPRKPKDKAIVENAVLIAQRWILAALRNHTFFNLAEANETIAKKLVEYNNRKMKLLDTSRRHLFETIDLPALKALPAKRFEYAQWSYPKVNIDYHVSIDKHFYSVPFQLVQEKVDARFTFTTVEIFHKNNRVAVHKRSYIKGRATTISSHMPESHQAQLKWSPSRIKKWAAKTGPNTVNVVTSIMDSRKHPELGFKACLGIMRLGKNYGDSRLEAASKRAMFIGSITYKSISSILENDLDKQHIGEPEVKPTIPLHDNIRGSKHYH